MEEYIQKELGKLKDWEIKDGKLFKAYEFRNFKEALEFVNKIGDAAEKKDHHPEIWFTYGKVKIELTTHKQGKITEKDFQLAKNSDEIYKNLKGGKS